MPEALTTHAGSQPRSTSRDDLTRFYLYALDDSTKRSRTAIILSLLLCIVVFAAWWNSLEFGWMRARRDSYGCAAWLYQQAGGDMEKIRRWGDYVQKRMAEVGVLGVDTRKVAKDLQKSARMLENMPPETRVTVTGVFTKLVEATHERVNVLSFPVLGLKFDVNDLGILGGMTLFTILFILQLCLGRELQNLAAVEQAGIAQRKVDVFYEIAAMRQVFSIPRQLAGAPRARAEPKSRTGKKLLQVGSFLREGLPRSASYLTYCSPLLVQGLVFFNDLYTRRAGYVTSGAMTRVELWGGGVWAGLILVLVYRTLKLAKGIHRQLDRMHEGAIGPKSLCVVCGAVCSVCGTKGEAEA